MAQSANALATAPLGQDRQFLERPDQADRGANETRTCPREVAATSPIGPFAIGPARAKAIITRSRRRRIIRGGDPSSAEACKASLLCDSSKRKKALVYWQSRPSLAPPRQSAP